MAYQNLSAAVTPAQITAIQSAIAALKTNLPFLVNLTKTERAALSKMGDATYSYVTKALDYAANNPLLVPSFTNLGEGRRDLNLYNDLRSIHQQLAQLVEGIDDTEMAAGIEAKEFADKFYASVQQAALSNVPGAKVIADDLGTFYAKTTVVLAPPPDNPIP
jgi:hypothetical protein